MITDFSKSLFKYPKHLFTIVMAFLKLVTYYIVLVSIIGLSVGNPQKPAFWKGTPMDSIVEEMRSNCDGGSDSLSCMKFKVASFLDTIFKKDNYQVRNQAQGKNNHITINCFKLAVR